MRGSAPQKPLFLIQGYSDNKSLPLVLKMVQRARRQGSNTLVPLEGFRKRLCWGVEGIQCLCSLDTQNCVLLNELFCDFEFEFEAENCVASFRIKIQDSELDGLKDLLIRPY